MRKLAVLAMTAILTGGLWTGAQEAPKAPAPQKEHNWLKQLDGEWETEGECLMEPGKPPVKSKGTESVRSLGGFWSINEMKGEFLGVSMTGVMTVGYDPQKKKYVGTWICSMADWLFKYEGTADGQVLTLECEGPSPGTGKLVKMKDVIEVKNKDHKVLSSFILGEDGKWVKFMTMHSRRKK